MPFVQSILHRPISLFSICVRPLNTNYVQVRGVGPTLEGQHPTPEVIIIVFATTMTTLVPMVVMSQHGGGDAIKGWFHFAVDDVAASSSALTPSS